MTTAPAPSPPTMNTLSIAIDGEIGMLTLERPESLNAMSPEMIGELMLASGWLADRAALQALIVTGSGQAFSAGGDVNWFQAGLDDPRPGSAVGRARHRASCIRRSSISGASYR